MLNELVGFRRRKGTVGTHATKVGRLPMIQEYLYEWVSRSRMNLAGFLVWTDFGFRLLLAVRAVLADVSMRGDIGALALITGLLGIVAESRFSFV